MAYFSFIGQTGIGLALYIYWEGLINLYRDDKRTFINEENMTPQTQWDAPFNMKPLSELIATHEDWLMHRVLYYAKDHGIPNIPLPSQRRGESPSRDSRYPHFSHPHHSEPPELTG